ncbi:MULTISPECIES: hypothetical protein [unclassified Pseudomonas]|uniref:hypothetical protein n=1 Tax=unclassified Pseudomonas TaxID=196821 RepID=UPI001F58A066|nr:MULTISPECIES: hypothetical protein [unclassified Pseudomonas]
MWLALSGRFRARWTKAIHGEWKRVTFNLKDFPDKHLAPFGIEAQHPDEFVENLFHLDSAAVVAAAQRQRKQLKAPTMDIELFLDLLQRQGLTQSVQALSAYRAML